MMESHYDPKKIEQPTYEKWEKLGVFTPELTSKKPKYSIVIPPPNVTGVLHMGHALTVTLEDILIRRKRMLGFNTLWLPGTDHASIATQMVVERHLQKEEKKSRHEIGREKFLERTWEWTRQSQSTIVSQLRKTGCSLDWTRLRFTMDESLGHAVRETFVRLYREGLIYQDEAITQWCPRCWTALSDLEVKFKEVKGKLWSIRYLIEGDPKRWVTVATTRPETLLGDTAVAVHPEDDRYVGFKGKKVIVPLVKRPVPIIEDSYVDRTFGTGALKVTPAHDPNDYLLGKRHRLQVINVMDQSARMNEEAGVYKGLAREKAREKVLEDLASQGLLDGEKELVHAVGHCDRCGTQVEPRIGRQWFANAEVLAKPAIAAVENGEIQIIPKEWEKTYFEWMRNIRPWCISRQLWWGHRIPAWYCGDCGKTTVALVDAKVCEHCGCAKIRQDEDVLDTWFSSALWPFSTLGWPKDTDDLKTFYPTDVLETGFDILFFWVARMIMMGIKMTGKNPFHTVYLHPMVRDEYGQKMSKTKGNVKDPLEIIDTKGADALRFTLASMAVHGRDVLLSDSRIEGYRNFANKIWNATRFVLLHFGDVQTSKIDRTSEVNCWIWSRFHSVKLQVNQALDQYKFYEAAERIYHFIWSDYCDWFLEFIKSKEELEQRKSQKESTAVEILEQALRLLHPLMPFVTEELWAQMPLRSREPSISVAAYPQAEAVEKNLLAEKRIGRVIAVVEGVRSKRGESNLSPAAEIHLACVANADVISELVPFRDLIAKLCKAGAIDIGESFKGKSEDHILISLDDIRVYIPRSDLVDVEKEVEKNRKELEQLEAEWGRADGKLKSAEFMSKAPPKVVEGVRERKELLETKIQALRQYLKAQD